jgi:MYXO-CTERM domain-containing protein
MTRRIFTILSLSALALTAQAGTVSYIVTINTPAYPGTGFMEFQFNQANAGTSLGLTTASISDVTQTGYTFGGNGGSTLGVSGTLSALPVVIPNDQAGSNYYDEIISTWGTSIRFEVTLAGDAVGGVADDGSGFYIFLYDDGLSPIVGPLANGEVGNILINPDGSTTPQGSAFEGGTATIELESAVPEPGTFLFGLAGLGGLIAMRRRMV